MPTCQLIAFNESPDRVLLDIVPLEALEVDGALIPRGLPLAMSFRPSDDPVAHVEMVELFGRWMDHDGVLDLDVAGPDAGRFRYVFTHEDEQLVLDVRV